ncbi:integrase [Plastorhodobacter daqingensis]|uniref:Integrase n=1 Tax=Plastorhodobacter daqingensis TaxID=1387281 RepID=A0ABW2US22_9RHOB
MAIKARSASAKGILSLYKRVPKRYEGVEPRKFVWVSLHTDSRAVADTKAATVWQQMVDAWEAKLAGDNGDAEQRFAAARDLAAAKGFRYLRAEQVAELPLRDLRDRFASVGGFNDPKAAPDMAEARALLGGAKEPGIAVSRALELYWSLGREKILGKSEDQVRRWKNPRIKAVKNFIAIVGDKPIDEITADDMLEFRDWWIERIETEALTANSANKDIIHLSDILRTVNRLKRLGLALPLSDLALKEGEKRQRPPFSVPWIKDKLLAPGALDGMNPEARGILLVMVNTGARPSEIANLSEARIRLSHDIPHISIEPEGRQLKSAYARRIIPLCGVSLKALRAFPAGFPRYRDKAGLSGAVNKFLRENRLLETPEHSLYSLRHAFEDRMLAAEVDDRIRRDLFGHTLDRERHGKGADLAHLQRAVQAIAL